MLVHLRSLKEKFIVAVGGVFLLSILVLSASVLLSVNAQVRNQLQESVHRDLEGFYSLLQIYEEESLARAQHFAERDTLVEAIRSGNIEEMRKVAVPMLQEGDMDYLVLTDAKGRTLFRAHLPDEIPAADDNILNQTNISRALQGESSVGVEEGRKVRLSVRAGAPVRFEGKVIGALSTGYVVSNNSDNSLVNEAKQIVGGDFSVFLGQERVACTVLGPDGKPLTTPLPEGGSSAGAMSLSQDPGLGSSYLAAFSPLVGAKGAPIGMVSAAKPLTLTSGIMRSIFWTAFWTVIVLLFPASAIVILLIHRIDRPLTNLRGLIASAGAGDLTVHGEIFSDDDISELLATKALERVPAESAGPGEIVAVAGIEDITIGETLTDAENPKPLPLIKVDDPAISMTIGINTSPLAGRVKGAKVTARQVKDRLDRELIGNVSIKVLPTQRPDAWELALAILVEQMRREGFELTVGKPQVVTKTIDGKVYEPMEHMIIDVPEEYLGAVTQLMAARKGRMENMANHGTGWVRMEFAVPARGLIGFRTQFLTETRGAGISSSYSIEHEPWAGEIEYRTNGSLIADRAGVVTPYAMINLQERGTFFVEPTSEVYEGMIVGMNSRADDMEVNITKEKKLTNMRSSTADNFENLTPPKKLTLEECLEFAREDECVEVTPEAIRIRKVILDANERVREFRRRARAN